jgi:DNA repair exonuclease SbcCD nuclease subunit
VTRLLATADWHIGAGRNIPGFLADQEDVFAEIATLALERGCDAIVHAGDVFEGPLVTPEQEDVFLRFIGRCRDADLPVFVISGNGRHDLAHRDVNALNVFRETRGVQVFDRLGVATVGDTAVCFLPWASTARLRAMADGGDVNDVAAELLLRLARDLRGNVHAAHTVLVWHGDVEGASLPSGLDASLFAPGPVLTLDDLERLGFDVIVAGHIHQPQLFLLRDDWRPIFYTGSPMALNFGEADADHGCWIVDLDNEGARAEFVATREGRRFVTVDLDEEDVRQAAGEPHRPLEESEGRHFMGRVVRDAVVRVRYHATEQQARRIDHQAMRDGLHDAGAHHVAAIEPTIVRAGAEASRLAGSFDDLEPRVAARSWLDAHVEDPDERAAAAAAADDYLEGAA